MGRFVNSMTAPFNETELTRGMDLGNEFRRKTIFQIATARRATRFFAGVSQADLDTGFATEQGRDSGGLRHSRFLGSSIDQTLLPTL